MEQPSSQICGNVVYMEYIERLPEVALNTTSDFCNTLMTRFVLFSGF